MQVGDLIKYKNDWMGDAIGVILGKSDVKRFWWVLWTNGKRFSEHERYLEVVKK